MSRVKIFRIFPVRSFGNRPTCRVCGRDPCADVPRKKPSFFANLFKRQPKPRPPPETCRLRLAEKKPGPDPDLSAFGGEPFKTCGAAYVIRKERAPETTPSPPSKKHLALKRMEAAHELKDEQEDPMPPFTNVEQRMMDLDARRLHPLYKKYRSTPRRKTEVYRRTAGAYRTRSGPVGPGDYPPHFRFDGELLEKKNMYAEYKRVKPPGQMVAKILEMRKNERTTLRDKFANLDAEKRRTKARRNVYDTLHQEDSVSEQYAE